jgi:hypothetical protein
MTRHRFCCSGPLPPLPSKPNRRRHFAFCGTIWEGTLVVSDGCKSDQFLLEWDATEGGWLLAKQTGDGEIYCTRPERCSCVGFSVHRHCRHQEILSVLVTEWANKNLRSQLTSHKESDIMELSAT